MAGRRAWIGFATLATALAGCGSGSAPAAEATTSSQPTDSKPAADDPSLTASSTAASLTPGSSAPRPAHEAIFTDITDQVGLDFTHTAGEDGNYHIAVIMSGGAGVFDANGDGLLDIYCINAGDALPTSKATNTVTNRYFEQQPDGTFLDRTEASGLGDNGYGNGCAIGDLDNDGDLDIYVTNWGPDALFRNNGDGTFTNITSSAGIRNPAMSASATLLDFDRDGLLDIYVANYVVHDPEKKCTGSLGGRDYCSPKSFRGEPDKLFRNEGNMTFRDVALSSGIAGEAKQGLGVIAADLSDDGWIDIYVANDGVDNLLWINNRDGTFTNQAHVKGVAVNQRGESEASMGVAIGDVNGDNTEDIFLTHLRKESNTLFINDGPAIGFSDRTAMSNLVAMSLPRTGFGTAMLDVDHDGDLDVAIANGSVTRMEPPLTDHPPFWCDYAEPNQLLRNDGKGRFENFVNATNAFTEEIEVSRGLIAADFDRDGDLDLFVMNLEGKARLYRNNVDGAAPGKSWIQIQTLLPNLKREAVGAVVTVVTSSKKLSRTVAPSAGYLTSTNAPLHFGLGSDEHVERIEVKWPDGRRERFPGCAARQLITIAQGAGEAEMQSMTRTDGP